MSSDLNIAILIPAAGASKRLGSPKQLLKWGDSTLMGHVIKNVKQLDAQQVLMVLGAHYDKIVKEVSTADVEIIQNKNWEQGLGSSIAAGAKFLLDSKSNVDAVLIVLVDQPFISTAYLAAMIADFNAEEGRIITTSYGNDTYGVPALFDKRYLVQLAKLRDDNGAKMLIKQNLDRVSAVAMTPILTDIDTKKDYNTFRETNHQ